MQLYREEKAEHSIQHPSFIHRTTDRDGGNRHGFCNLLDDKGTLKKRLLTAFCLILITGPDQIRSYQINVRAPYLVETVAFFERF